MKAPRLACPSCGFADLDVRDYDSMIVVSSDYALFALRCPGCGQRLSSLYAIPDDLRDEIHLAALEVGAGMGRAN